MIKRMIAMLLCAAMVFCALPAQAFATESTEQTTQATELEETMEETLLVQDESEASEPETEPIVQEEEPETSEPEAEPTQAAAQTEPAETEESEGDSLLLVEEEPAEAARMEWDFVPPEPVTHFPTVTTQPFTKTEDVRVVEKDENGNILYYDATETTSGTVHIVTPSEEEPVGAAYMDSSNQLSFATFAELKALVSQSYSSTTYAHYTGEESLIITEDLTLPDNLRVEITAENCALIISQGVTFHSAGTNGSLYLRSLIIHGTFISRSYVNVIDELTVNGTLQLFRSLYLEKDTVFNCTGTIRYSDHYRHVVREYPVDNLEDFKSAIAQAAADTSECVYEISLELRSDVTLTESVTVPSNATLFLRSVDSFELTLAQGCTLELNCANDCHLGNLVVAGTLINNCDYLYAQRIAFTETGKYTGSGVLRFSSSDPSLTLEDFVPGLDMTNIEATKYSQSDSDWYSWELRDITGLVKLGTPTNLQWNVMRNGNISWKTAEPDQGHATVRIYKVGEDAPICETHWYFGSTDMPEDHSVADFILADADSGSYYFTVQSIADGTGYCNSDVATSGIWTYTKPNRSTGSCSNLRWDWPRGYWNGPSGSTMSTNYDVEIYYSATRNGEPLCIGGTFGALNGHMRVPDSFLQEWGTGYYSFRVRTISDDITVKCNSPWSALSPAYSLNQLTQEIKDNLTDITENETDPDAIREAVQNLDTESLKSAMLADKGSEGVMDTLAELENAVGGAAGVQVNDGASAFDADKVSIVGANLNNAAADSADPITLVIDKPQAEHVLDAAYDNSVAVSFAMTLENVADAENLDVPVKITMPVPANINPEFLVIMHYRQDGVVEELINGVDVYIFRENGQYYASFVLTSFSDFIMTQTVEGIVDSGTTASGLTWTLSTWNQLRISGIGAIDDCEDSAAPWADYQDSVTSVVIEEGVTRIGVSAFANFPKLTSVSIPDSVTAIANSAFLYCESLKELSIGANVEVIGWFAFYGCKQLTHINVAQDNEVFASLDGVLFSKDLTILMTYPAGKPDSAYTAPQGVETIDAYSVCDCQYLTEVTLPDSLRSIGREAFSNCSSLERIVFEGGPVEIADDAFVNVTASVSYPADGSWTEDAMGDYGGNLTWLPSRYVEVTGEAELLAGKMTKLTARILPNAPVGAKITWALADGDSLYATMRVVGNTVMVTAADVSEPHTVTVIAQAGKDVAPCEYKLTVNPKAKLVELYAVRDDSSLLDLSESPWWPIVLDAQNPNGFFVQLTADVLPEGANSKVTWKSSNPAVAAIQDDGTAKFTGKAGTVKFTATSAESSLVKAEVTYKVVQKISAQAVGSTAVKLAAGQSCTLQVKNAATGKLLGTRNVLWTLISDNGDDCEAYAAISKSGKLTTKKVMQEVTFRAQADVLADDVCVQSIDFHVTLYPAATHMEILDGGVPVNDQTVPFDVNSSADKTLSVKLYPDDVIDTPVQWSISDAKKQEYAQYQLDAASGTLTISGPTKKSGTVTITAAAQDGSRKKVTVKIRFGTFAENVTITNTEKTLTVGSSLKLDAEITPKSLTTPGLVWSLKDPADKAYVTLIGSKLTAKTVYDDRPVTVVASTKDGCASGEYTVTIVPKDSQMLILKDAGGKNVTNDKIYVDLNAKDPTVTLSAHTYGTTQEEQVTWSPSVNARNAKISLENGRLKVTMLSGTLNVQATAADGRKASVTIAAAKLASKVTIATKDGKNMTSDDNGGTVITVASGKSVSLKALLENAAKNSVSWSVTDGAAYAKISSIGTLTAAKDITSEKRVTVCATAQDGSNVSGTATVLIKPLAQGLQIYSAQEDSLRVSSNDRVRGNTTLVWDMAAKDAAGNSKDTIQLSAYVYPFYDSSEERNAIQEVTWKSTLPKVADIDSSGKITCLKAGSTTITATAADGSGQKVSFKLTVVKRMKSLTLTDAVVVGGKSVTLKPVIGPSDTTNQKLTWSMTGDTAFAKLSNGALTTAKVTSVKTLRVFAEAQDGSGQRASCEVKIYPASTTAVQILRGAENVTGKTLTMREGEQLALTGQSLPKQAAQEWVWTSSSANDASVEDGVVTAHKAGKTVSIVCTAADGSGKKAAVTIKVLA